MINGAGLRPIFVSLLMAYNRLQASPGNHRRWELRQCRRLPNHTSRSGVNPKMNI